MGRIVREHYPLSKLPEDLRHGLAPDGEARVTVEETARSNLTAAAPKAGQGQFSRLRHLARDHFASSAEIDAHVDALRTERDHPAR